jgi:hypothetical protein
MLRRVDYSVIVPASSDAAFLAFLHFERLLHRGIYDEASWVEGVPWQVGSRLRYGILKPIPATVTAVVTSISLPHSVNLLNHALGITAEENVTFAPDRGGTRIRIIMNMFGKSNELSEHAIHEAVTFIARDALDTVLALCRRRGRSAAG